MKSKLKKFIMNPWTITVGGGLIVLFVTIAIDIFTAATILSTLRNILIIFWKCIISFLNFELKVWWVLIGIAAVVFVLHIMAEYYDYKLKQSDKPLFLEYTKDYILGYNWKWIWQKNYEGKYDIENLYPVCNNCGTPLTYSSTDFGRLVCLRCQEEYRQSLPREEDIKLMIIDNVRRKYFPNE